MSFRHFAHLTDRSYGLSERAAISIFSKVSDAVVSVDAERLAQCVDDYCSLQLPFVDELQAQQPFVVSETALACAGGVIGNRIVRERRCRTTVSLTRRYLVA